jgi:hypothetical protein
LTNDNFELKNVRIRLSEDLANSIRKDENDRIHEENEKLRTSLTETRAAMLNYKNMTVVIADQVKNLKLVHERKKDEHENLLEALREMQSDGQTKERVGKLYFIIMLSRWQEASVNKKYEAVLSEVKNLRGELMSSQAMRERLEEDIGARDRTDLQKLGSKLEQERQENGKNKSYDISQSKVNEYKQLIETLAEEKSNLEIDHLTLRSKLKDAEDKVDDAAARADTAEALLNDFKNNRQSDLSDKLVEMSDQLQKIRLGEYRARRKAEEEEQRIKYIQELLKSKDERLRTLEERASKVEGDMHKQAEEFRKRDNERQRQFFFTKNFDDITSKVTNQVVDSAAIESRLDKSIKMTETSTQRLGTANEATGIKRIEA